MALTKSEKDAIMDEFHRHPDDTGSPEIQVALLTKRINRLTDAELARINQEADTLKAGGTNVLGILLIIFIVFVITDVIGATNIFPFIRPVK